MRYDLDETQLERINEVYDARENEVLKEAYFEDNKLHIIYVDEDGETEYLPSIDGPSDLDKLKYIIYGE